MKADLHVHTYYSDGLLSPTDAVRLAKAGGVNLMSVTDHDTMLATGEVKSLCAENGINFVSGIEISAYFGDVKVHTLGYCLDENNPQFKRFLTSLETSSLRRAEDIISKLTANGVKLTVEEAAKERRSPLSPIHAMHIARAAAKKGYGENPYAFYMQYLMPGKCGYSRVGRPTPEQAVEAIASGGGFSSLAHPGRITISKQDLISLIDRMKACGLGGIEGVYSTHTAKDTAYYKEIAKSKGLLITGGSDTHAENRNRSIGKPYFRPDGKLLQAFNLD